MNRADAIERLERHGIDGADIYLIDLIPLIEMMWADGLLQRPERELFDEFMVEHVASINHLAGMRVLTVEHARRFAARFLATRPNDHLMQELCALVPPVRLHSSDTKDNEARRQAIMEWCLDIGAACVTHYPYGNRQRFKDVEKERFFSILKALTRPS